MPLHFEAQALTHLANVLVRLERVLFNLDKGIDSKIDTFGTARICVASQRGNRLELDLVNGVDSC